MKVERFSNGYYTTQVYIEPNTGRTPTLNRRDYDILQKELNSRGDSNTSIMLKVRKSYFEVEPDTGTPEDVLTIPIEYTERLPIRRIPSREEVLIPKPWVTQMLKGEPWGQSEQLYESDSKI